MIWRTIIESLTGRVPFDADTPVSVALKHMQEEPIAAIVANPNIPIAVNDIIMKSLKKDPNLRYQSATAMLIDLKRALKEPQGNFVDNNEYVDAPTQRISTIQDDNRGPKATAKKKENKFVAFVKKHKVLSTIVGLILLFVLSLGTTLGIANATRTKDVAIPNLVGKTVDETVKRKVESLVHNARIKSFSVAGVAVVIKKRKKPPVCDETEGFLLIYDFQTSRLLLCDLNCCTTVE